MEVSPTKIGTNVEIRVKLIGLLRAKAPDGNVLQLSDSASVDDALEMLGIPSSHVHLAMVNGEHAHDRSRVLRPDDELLVFPPVAGG
jgi:molybdopterin converting factor small subunit